MKVLIIDDDAEDTEMFRDALKDVAPHVSCTVANDSSSGLAFIHQTIDAPPQFIFLDANLSLVDGRECLQELRKIHHLKDTRIIMYSGYISPEQEEEFKNLGADEYVKKPNTYDHLLKVLQRMLL